MNTSLTLACPVAACIDLVGTYPAAPWAHDAPGVLYTLPVLWAPCVPEAAGSAAGGVYCPVAAAPVAEPGG